MDYYNEEIERELNFLFLKVVNLDFIQKNNNLRTTNLFGRPFYIKARDMLTLFMEVEKKFGIEIPMDIILQDRFNTFDTILHIICDKVEWSRKLLNKK